MVSRIKWASIGGFAVGVGMLVVAALRGDVAWLVAAVFVVIVSLFGGKLQEFVANKDGFRALFFDDYAKAVADQLTSPQSPASPPIPSDSAPREALSRPPQVLHRTAEDGVSTIDEAVVTVHPSTATGSATAQAAALIVRPQDVAAARNEQELASRVIEYLKQTMVHPIGHLPALRGLSTRRIAAEQDLFGAVLELQSDRHRGGDLGTQDAYELAIQNEIVGWWADPSSLEDDEVSDLARRVRNLIDYRTKRKR